MKTLFLITFLVSSLFLSGCASLNSKFDCPMKPGVMCKSLDEVNAMVDQGKLGGKSSNSEQLTSFSDNSVPSFTPALNTCSQPLRSDETIARIWIAPHEDGDGDYYAPSLLYRVVKSCHWSDHLIKVNDEEGENV